MGLKATGPVTITASGWAASHLCTSAAVKHRTHGLALQFLLPCLVKRALLAGEADLCFLGLRGLACRLGALFWSGALLLHPPLW